VSEKAAQPAGPPPEAPLPEGRVVLLAGPSGSGKSHLARSCGLPVLCLDDFYKSGDDPSCPRDEVLGIVDWDHPGSWDADAAMAAVLAVCRNGTADVPAYDIAADRVSGIRHFSRGGHAVFVAEGIFVSELVSRCRAAGVLADAIVINRAPWKNFVRRLSRDLAERRKPPVTLLRRGRALMREEAVLLTRLQSAGFRPLTAPEAREALRQWAVVPAHDSP
jgi:uridine kinase